MLRALHMATGGRVNYPPPERYTIREHEAEGLKTTAYALHWASTCYVVDIGDSSVVASAKSFFSMRAAYKAAWHQYRLFRYEQRLEA